MCLRTEILALNAQMNAGVPTDILQDRACRRKTVMNKREIQSLILEQRCEDK